MLSTRSCAGAGRGDGFFEAASEQEVVPGSPTSSHSSRQFSEVASASSKTTKNAPHAEEGTELRGTKACQ